MQAAQQPFGKLLAIPKQRCADRTIGYAHRVTVTWYGKLNGTVQENTDSYYCEGKTKAAAFAASKAEQSKQLAMEGTVSCVISSDAFPVTKPLQ